MWQSRSMEEPKITLNKHKTSSPFGVSALYSGSKKDGWPQSISGQSWLGASSIALLAILHSSGLSVSRLTPTGLTLLWWGSKSPWRGMSVGRHSRDQPLEREGGRCERERPRERVSPWSVTLTGLGVGNAYTNLKILCFPGKSRRKHLILFFFI